ncbi:hypothetical protein NKH77_20675 [Streptomyces sp. M19]
MFNRADGTVPVDRLPEDTVEVRVRVGHQDEELASTVAFAYTADERLGRGDSGRPTCPFGPGGTG